jgi:enoyl-CoA hydratase/carnithine racemase
MTFQPSPLISFSRRDTTCTILLNRPEVLNALSPELSQAITDAIREFERDSSLRVAIIGGEGGRAFSSGGDLKRMAEIAAQQPEGERQGFPIPRLGSMHPIDDIANCTKPVIAAIDGYCLAGGFEIALTCDIRIATTASTFGLPEARRGMLSGPGLHNLSRMIPLGEALRLHLTGGTITAARAHQIGLVQEVVDERRQLFDAAAAMAHEIALCAPDAVRALKHIVRRGREVPVEYSWIMAEPYQEQLARTAGIDGTRAFAEKRLPAWGAESQAPDGG